MFLRGDTRTCRDRHRGSGGSRCPLSAADRKKKVSLANLIGDFLETQRRLRDAAELPCRFVVATRVRLFLLRWDIRVVISSIGEQCYPELMPEKCSKGARTGIQKLTTEEKAVVDRFENLPRKHENSPVPMVHEGGWPARRRLRPAGRSGARRTREAIPSSVLDEIWADRNHANLQASNVGPLDFSHIECVGCSRKLAVARTLRSRFAARGRALGFSARFADPGVRPRQKKKKKMACPLFVATNIDCAAAASQSMETDFAFGPFFADSHYTAIKTREPANSGCRA